MFDLICIFTTGGIVVWYKSFCSTNLDLVNVLIKNVFLAEKTSQTQYTHDKYIFKWRLASECNLVFAVIYREVLQLLYIDQFMDYLKESYLDKAFKQLKIKDGAYIEIPDYEAEYREVMKKWENFKEKIDQESRMRSFVETNRGKQITEDQKKRDDQVQHSKKAPSKKKPAAKQEEKKDDENGEGKGEEGKEDEEGKEEEGNQEEKEQKQDDGGESPENAAAEVRERLRGMAGRKHKGKKPAPPVVPEKTEEPRAEDAKSKAKAPTQSSVAKKVTAQLLNQLDHSKKKGVPSPGKKIDDYMSDDKEAQAMEKLNEEGHDGLSDDGGHPEKEEEKKAAPKKEGLFSKLTNKIKSFTGHKLLTEDDLIPVLKEFRENLIQKNLATEISDQICASVKTSLLSQKTAAFTSVKATVKAALNESIEKLLTPKVNIDILKDAQIAKTKGVPYSIVFIGVNGVGKSTTLAKVAYYLKTKGKMSVMIAACDNFRAGAVEQVKTHGRCLDIPVFDRGYGNDAAQICKEALHEAKAKKRDVVLIDTAGRMQDNEPLMRALAKLIYVNRPDVILFVGEALVGNDATDQLTKFNKSLIDFSLSETPRTIDGIILTKFDTVDDKVGAALSMVYTTGKPIVFVGVGQKYPNLVKLNVNNVVRILMG